VTPRSAQHSLVLADDGIIDPIAVELAARGTRTVALTRLERQLAAARILARGGTPYLISKRLHVNGTTALTLAARCQDVTSRPSESARGAKRRAWQHDERD
jgi:DNA-binding CsgD family transcriptional regulator